MQVSGSISRLSKATQADVQLAAAKVDAEFEKDWAQATSFETESHDTASAVLPAYKHPGKNWRLKKGATPQWYKARNGVRTKALSGAARVARYRPKKFH